MSTQTERITESIDASSRNKRWRKYTATVLKFLGTVLNTDVASNAYYLLESVPGSDVESTSCGPEPRYSNRCGFYGRSSPANLRPSIKVTESKWFKEQVRNLIWPRLLYVVQIVTVLHMALSLVCHYARDISALRLDVVKSRVDNQRYKDNNETSALLLETWRSKVEFWQSALDYVGSSRVEQRFVGQSVYAHLMITAFIFIYLPFHYKHVPCDFQFWRKAINYADEFKMANLVRQDVLNDFFLSRRIFHLKLQLQKTSTLSKMFTFRRRALANFKRDLTLIDDSNVDSANKYWFEGQSLLYKILSNELAKINVQQQFDSTVRFVLPYMFSYVIGLTFMSGGMLIVLAGQPRSDFALIDWIINLEFLQLIIWTDIVGLFAGSTILFSSVDQVLSNRHVRWKIRLCIEQNALDFDSILRGKQSNIRSHAGKRLRDELNYRLITAYLFYKTYEAQLKPLKNSMSWIPVGMTITSFQTPLIFLVNSPYFDKSMAHYRYLISITSFAIAILQVPLYYGFVVIRIEGEKLHAMLHNLLAHSVSVSNCELRIYEQHTIGLIRRCLSDTEENLRQFSMEFFGMQLKYSNVVRINFWFGLVWLMLFIDPAKFDDLSNSLVGPFLRDPLKLYQ